MVTKNLAKVCLSMVKGKGAVVRDIIHSANSRFSIGGGGGTMGSTSGSAGTSGSSASSAGSAPSGGTSGGTTGAGPT
ncbi:hypothetical protein P3S67_002372 [Capsicum chacoense]